jgi:hypothetical protein
MSAKLSRRYGQAVSYPPLAALPAGEKLDLARLTYERRTEFEDLPERYQRLILEAEANRQRHIEALAAGDSQTVDELSAEALGLRKPVGAER